MTSATLGVVGASTAVLLDSSPAGATPLEAIGAQVVFDPSTASSSNSFETWPEVVAAIQEAVGARRIVVVGEASVPPNVGNVPWDLGSGPIIFEGNGVDWWFENGATLTLENNCKFSGPIYYAVDAGLLLKSTSSTYVIEQTNEIGGLVAQRGGGIASTTHPIYLVSGSSKKGVLQLNSEGRAINADAIGMYGVNPGGAELMEATDDATVVLTLGPGSTFTTDDLFVGDAGTTLVTFVMTSSPTLLPEAASNAAWSGSEVHRLTTRADALGYEPTVEDDWRSAPATVHRALDRLAGDTVTTTVIPRSFLTGSPIDLGSGGIAKAILTRHGHTVSMSFRMKVGDTPDIPNASFGIFASDLPAEFRPMMPSNDVNANQAEWFGYGGIQDAAQTSPTAHPLFVCWANFGPAGAVLVFSIAAPGTPSSGNTVLNASGIVPFGAALEEDAFLTCSIEYLRTGVDVVSV